FHSMAWMRVENKSGFIFHFVKNGVSKSVPAFRGNFCWQVEWPLFLRININEPHEQGIDIFFLFPVFHDGWVDRPREPTQFLFVFRKCFYERVLCRGKHKINFVLPEIAPPLFRLPM